MTRRSPWLSGILLVPMLLVFGVALVVVAGERAGLTPLGGTQARNAAEAAGLGDSGEMLRLLRSTDDPVTVYPVRPAIISSAVQWVTTFEAAVWSRRVEMVALLDREGFLPVEEDRRRLACLAADLGVDDVVEYLAPGGAGWCVPQAFIEAVLERTRERSALNE